MTFGDCYLSALLPCCLTGPVAGVDCGLNAPLGLSPKIIVVLNGYFLLNSFSFSGVILYSGIFNSPFIYISDDLK